MVACQQPHHQSLGQDEGHLARTADVVISLSAVVEEEEDTMTEDHTMIGDQVEAYHQANGGGARRHQSVSRATVEEEEAVVAVAEGQTAIGMGEEEEDGDLPQVSIPHRYRHRHHRPTYTPLYSAGPETWRHCTKTMRAERQLYYYEIPHDRNDDGQ